MSFTSPGVVASSFVRGGYTTIAYEGAGAVGSATGGSNFTLAYPVPAGGILANDFFWIPVASSLGAGTTYASNAISGFTRRFTNDAAGSSPNIAGFYRKATGSESGSVTVNSPGGATVGRMYIYRGVDPTTPFDVADALFGISTADTDYVIPTQTPSHSGCAALILGVGNAATSSFTPPSGYTELYDGNGAGSSSTSFHGHRLNLAVSATGTRTIVRAGAIRGSAAGVILRSAAA